MHVQPTHAVARRALGDSSGVSQASLLSALATLRDALAPGQALPVSTVLDQPSVLATSTLSVSDVSVPTTPIPISAPVRVPAPVWSAGNRRVDRFAAQCLAPLPDDVLARADMREAIIGHDFGTVFRLARKWAGISYCRIAEVCEIKPERVCKLAKGEGRITTFSKVVQIADGLRIPGYLLGLSARPWEQTTTGSGAGR